MTLGSRKFYRYEPVLYFDTLTTSSLEGASTTVYAQGGRGNTRLIAWEGERTLTFNMTDALLTPEGFSILSGAGLIEANTVKPIYVHTTTQVQAEPTGSMFYITEDPTNICWNGGRNSTTTEATAKGKGYVYHSEADIFCMKLDDYGEVAAEPCVPASVEVGFLDITDATGEKTFITTKPETEVTGHTYQPAAKIVCFADGTDGEHVNLTSADVVLVDYYVKRTSGVQQIEITAESFGGNFYIEASTLFRRESDGKDMPAEFIIPNGKIQSNFTFTMAASGDPSTFDFVVDAFPDYTKFDRTKKVLAAIQVVYDETGDTESDRNACKVPSVGG